jgi:hypothetical protein
MTVHNFNESLARSHSYADAPWWEDVYRQAFPGFASMVSVREDGWAQRGGIDRSITLKSGKTLWVDEKVREKEWADVLLERWSDSRNRVPGWIQKDLACDYIAYAFAPLQKCYLLPFQPLRRAWILNGRQWCEEYKEVRADNGRYVTVSVAIPTDILFAALNGAMVVNWAKEAA